MVTRPRSLGSAVLLLALPALAGAQCELEKLVPVGGEAFDAIGTSLALDGTVAVVGAPGDDLARGSATVFERRGLAWVETARLVAADGSAGDAFGGSVAVSGDRIAVGASLDDDLGGGSGAVFVFERSGSSWSEVAKVLASDGSAGDQLGSAVALDGTRLVAGAQGDDDRGPAAGAAYVFDLAGATWVESAKLTAADGAADDGFGSSLALDGDLVAIGASQDDDLGSDAGSAYVFELQGASWTQDAKLLASDGATLDKFARALALSGETVLVGVFGNDDQGSKAGAGYVFDRQGTAWVESAKLLASDGDPGDHLGIGVALDGDTALLGAIYDDDLGGNAGAAYRFDRVGGAWSETAKLLASDGRFGDRFGFTVALSGDDALVGAYLEDELGVDAGAAYAVSLSGAACPTLFEDLRVVSVSAGGTQELTLRPGASFAGDPFVLAGSLSGVAPGVLAGAFVVPLNPDPYFASTTLQPGPPLFGSVGTLDASGVAGVQLRIPAGSDPTLAGRAAYHAYLVFDATTGAPVAVSDPALVVLAP